MKLSTAAKVGLFTVIGLIVLAVMISWKANLGLIRQGYRLIGSFSNIEGLTIGSEVRYRGLNVGQVLKIDPGVEDIKIYAVIKKGIKIPADSTLRVSYDGIVGQKFLEIRPGTLEAILYEPGDTLQGISTAGIVDFVDIAAQNLQETRAILANFRLIVEDPSVQYALKNAVFTAEKAALEIDKLASELRETNAGIRAITTDPKFQDNVKGTVSETHKTLESANTFFEGFGKISLRPSADVQYGSANNVVRGNLDFYQSQRDYLRVGIGEGPTRDLGLQDLLISRRFMDVLALKLGMINNRLGGGLDLFPSERWVLSGDVYDISNPKPNVPKIRITSAHEVVNYLDLLLQADDIFNSDRNYSIGVRIKAAE